MSVFLSIVIPAYNEEKRIEETLEKILNYLKTKNYQYEIIVVDDGSSDNTVKVLETIAKENKNIFILKNEQNSGKGYSVRKGVLESKGDYILFSDADLSTPIEEVEKLLHWLNQGFDVTIGSRGLKESDIKIHQPFYRELMGKFFNFLVQTLLIKGIKDTQCGFKCFKKDATKEIFKRQKIDGFGFDVEILYIAKKLNYKIKEVPVTWLNSPNSKVSPIKHSLEMFKDILKIKFGILK